MSKYNIKEEEKNVDLPLTVGSIQKWIKQKLGKLNPEDPISVVQIEELKTELYRDVLIVVSTGAAHSADLAKAALVVEEIQAECLKIKEKYKAGS